MTAQISWLSSENLREPGTICWSLCGFRVRPSTLSYGKMIGSLEGSPIWPIIFGTTLCAPVWSRIGEIGSISVAFCRDTRHWIRGRLISAIISGRGIRIKLIERSVETSSSFRYKIQLSRSGSGNRFRPECIQLSRSGSGNRFRPFSTIAF